MKVRMNHKRNGFTLIEMIVILAIIGLLAAIVIPRLSHYQDQAEKRVCEYNIKQLKSAFIIYCLEDPSLKSSAGFTMFILEQDLNHRTCPSGAPVEYSDETGIYCPIHPSSPSNSPDDDLVDPPDDPIPYI